ncbi:FAD-dependent tricarballylate dehydrogenase TcuA [Thiocystis violascens]|uniref:Precorrin 3B synthase CobZ n=1 Tax=Thiocystis violascens (strain ATCC 17096 / DSM 198 / 6111) TaxID=765911 RepID=I3Y9I4_THIV6|nr:FAD-dependent tricarballylate dehydrogenase TcuA [Thiocystis violascens]AFL73652.1 precorrin 3B synthase CobZ [Thiocystis violascens DSM 198]
MRAILPGLSPASGVLPTRPDVLVIGGGAAALCAAIAARRAGASVLLLEEAPRWLRGGNTRHSRNLRVMHESPSPLSVGVYPEAEFASDLQRATGGTTDPALARRLIQGSAEIADWLAGSGVLFQPTASGVLPPSRKTAFLLGGGTAMVNALYATAERLGVMIRYDCAVRDPRIGQGHLERIHCQQGSGTWALQPRAAIVCCGGSQANRDWLRDQWGNAAEGFINRGTPFATGEVLHALLRQGALPVGDPRGAYLVAVDARSPSDDGGIVTRVRCMPAGIVVDTHGRRIHDEGGDTASTRYALWGQRLAACPGQIAYLILDARGLRKAPPSLYPPLAADSIGGLAARLEIPAATLAETVARYNAAVRPPAAGADDSDWRTDGLEPPKSRHARPLIEPPFGAWPMRPGITFTYFGIAVDADTRVRLHDGGTVENLFAAGMIMAPNLIGRGYVSGLALTIGCVFGRIAGAEAARHARG